MSIEYFIKFSALLILFWGFYKLFLQGETFFNAIRVYFVLGIIGSLVLPTITITQYVYLEQLNFNQITDSVSQANNGTNPAGINIAHILLFVYFAGVVALSVRFLLQVFSLARFIWKSPGTRNQGYILIESETASGPFSFFNYIIYPPNRFSEKELKQILVHEKVHASHFHSIDILMAQLLIIFNWFNPVAWLYHRDVQKNLEFIADRGVKTDSSTRTSYQYLLLKSISPVNNLTLTSNFYNSLIIKKRINMLHKNKSNHLMHVKFIFIVPLLIAFVFSFNTETVAQIKKEEKYEVRKNIEAVIITKDFQKSDLSELKTSLLKKGITLSYKKLKYNTNNEIIGIQLSVANEQNNKSQIAQSGTDPIKPISIKFDDEGSLAIGNLEEMDNHNAFFYKTSGDKNKNVIVVEKSDVNAKGDQNFVWVSENGDKTEVKIVNGEKISVRTSGNEEVSEDVWVSDSGDSTFVQKIEVIGIEGKNDGENKVIIKKIQKNDEDEDVIVETSVVGPKDEKMLFISGDGDKPLLIVDGVEKPHINMDDIDPEDIESIDVLKGDKAIEEYGQKAKNGVVKITTKK